VDPVPDPLLLRKSGSAGDRTRDLCICSQRLWPLDHRGGRLSIICGNKMPTRCNRRVFYCISFCLLNMFRAPLCPSSGTREYYTSGCCLSYLVLGFQAVGIVCSCGLCVRFAGCWLSSWFTQGYILFPAEVQQSCSISKYNYLQTSFNIFPQDNWFQNYQR
jgi:hypothetical protein